MVNDMIFHTCESSHIDILDLLSYREVKNVITAETSTATLVFQRDLSRGTCREMTKHCGLEHYRYKSPVTCD